MMIEGVRLGVAGVARVGRTGRGGAAPGFSVLPGEETEAAAVAAPARLLGLDSLLALQEAGTDAVGERAARRHGEDQLAALRRVQLGMLAPGGVAAADLERLAQLDSTPSHVADPFLRDILAAIGLRARIELAKRATGRGTA